jgi:hypothetical protein
MLRAARFQLSRPEQRSGYSTEHSLADAKLRWVSDAALAKSDMVRGDSQKMDGVNMVDRMDAMDGWTKWTLAVSPVAVSLFHSPRISRTMTRPF